MRFSQEYSLNISGGDQKGSYMYSGGYLDQQGVIVNSYYKRYNVRANNNRKINDYVEIGSNLTFTKSENRLARTNTENYGVIESAIAFNRLVRCLTRMQTLNSQKTLLLVWQIHI